MLEKNQRIMSVTKPEGDGAEVKRLFPTKNYDSLDPFVLLDQFFVEPPNEFAPHEHRGFEAVTYMLEGSFWHKDNQGNEAEVKAGGVQAFNAGSGIVHSESPGEGELSRGIQLWVNIPREEKDSEPYYRQIPAEEVPEQKQEGLKVRTIAGPGAGLELMADVIFQDVEIAEGGCFNVQLSGSHQGIIYVIAGEIQAGEPEEKLKQDEGYLLAANSTLEVRSLSPEARFIFLAGEPLGEPIKIRGSFVE